jgi:hypothetical protein
MLAVSDEQWARTRDYIYRHGRLLERTLFERFFGGGSRASCLRALLAYQNADGGFGNGIEPDLLCPDSSAIGAETAMYVLDLLDAQDIEAVDRLVSWIAEAQNERGIIPHPSGQMLDYPHQPWWENADDTRVLTLAGLLAKWGRADGAVLRGARRYYESAPLPDEWSFYAYPFYVYLRYAGETDLDHERLSGITAHLPALIEGSADHYPLFSRYWCYAADKVSQEVLLQEAGKFLNALQEDGGLDAPYPDLPWWRPIFTLDGLIALRKQGLI